MWRLTWAGEVLYLHFVSVIILCSNVQGPCGSLNNLTGASSQNNILLLYETLVSEMRHVSELPVPGFGACVGAGCIRPRYIWSISPTKISVWLLRNAVFYGLQYVKELLCVFSLT